MSSSTVFRVSGVILIVGAFLLIVGTLFHPDDPLSPLYVPASTLNFIGTMLALVSLPGVYARLHKRIGIVGLIGFALIFFSGLMYGIGGGILAMAVDPYLAQHAPALLSKGNGPAIFAVYFPVAGIMQTLGAILFGITTLRAGALLGTTRWAGVLLMVGGIVDFIGNFSRANIVGNIGSALYFAAFIWFGYFLVTEQRSESAPSMIATAKA